MLETDTVDGRIAALLERLEPITLDEMADIKLMNRTDTKFVTNKRQLARLLELAEGEYYAQQNAGSKIADYMTTYWDTPGHHFYLEHHNGRAPRQKVRVRTYMDSGVTFLEVKTKNNHGRTKKKRIEVAGQDMAGEHDMAEEFVGGLVNRSLATMRPTVRNRFHRITLVNKGKTERLTIDFDVRFRNLETQREAQTGELVIIELKRDGNVYSPVLDILRRLRVKPSGFSKYCIGSVLTNEGLKKNLFKQKLVRIGKLVEG